MMDIEITYKACIKKDIDSSDTRYERYKKSIKSTIEKEYPNASVIVVDSNTLDPELDIDFNNNSTRMDTYDRINEIINGIEY